MKINLLHILVLFIFTLPAPSQADTFPAYTLRPFDWQKAWGSFSEAPSVPDPGIPAEQHPIKLSIKKTFHECLKAGAPLSALSVYQLDLNGDDKLDYLLDASGIRNYIKADCPEKICVDDGCFAVVYYGGPVSQILKKAEADAGGEKADVGGEMKTATADEATPVAGEQCPASPEANKSCRPDCPAKAEMCPHLFVYNFEIAYTNPVTAWHLHSAEFFPPNKRAMESPYKVGNNFDVISFERPLSDCYQQEITFNGNVCTKYFQHSSSSALRDIFELYAPPFEADNRTMFTTEAYNRNVAQIGRRGDQIGAGQGRKLEPGKSFMLQIESYDHDDDPATPGEFLCQEFHNITKGSKDERSFFLPLNSDKEIRALVRNTPAGLVSQDCARHFTAWSGGPFVGQNTKAGVLECGQLTGLPCHAEVELYAERFCERSTGALTTCQECLDKDADKSNEYKAAETTAKNYRDASDIYQRLQNVVSLIQSNAIESAAYRDAIKFYKANHYIVSTINAEEYGGMRLFLRDRYYYNSGCAAGKALCDQLQRAVADLFGPTGQVHPVAILYDESSVCRRRQLCHLNVGNCTHSVSCFAPTTLITMGDGSTRELREVKPGDTVLAFDAKDPTGALHPAKVKSIRITDDQPLISLNGMKVTANHPLILANGKVVPASDVKTGDRLALAEAGKSALVQMIVRERTPSSVLNLELETGGGFIADGKRVLGETPSVKEK